MRRPWPVGGGAVAPGGRGFYQLLNSLHTVIQEAIKPSFAVTDNYYGLAIYRLHHINTSILKTKYELEYTMIIICTAFSYVKTFSAHYFGKHYLIKIAFILS
jgi:hypothetical protein